MGKRPKRSTNHPPRIPRGKNRRTAYAFVTQMALGSIALGGFGVGVYLSVTGASTEEVRVLDELTYQRVEQLRQTMAVTNEDLALMEVTPEQAEVVIQSVLAWSDQNGERLAGAERVVREAETQLRLARRALQSGQVQRDTPKASYEELSAAVDEAKASQREVVKELETQLSAQLIGVDSDWTAAKLNAGWLSDNSASRLVESILLKAVDFRIALQGDTDSGDIAANVQMYRERLANVGEIQAVSQSVYRPPVIIKPLAGLENYTER